MISTLNELIHKAIWINTWNRGGLDALALPYGEPFT